MPTPADERSGSVASREERMQHEIWERNCPFLLAKCERYEEALREIRMLTVEIGDSVEAATRASHIAIEALDG